MLTRRRVRFLIDFNAIRPRPCDKYILIYVNTQIITSFNGFNWNFREILLLTNKHLLKVHTSGITEDPQTPRRRMKREQRKFGAPLPLNSIKPYEKKK